MSAMQSRIDDFGADGVGPWNRRSPDIVQWAQSRADQLNKGVADRAGSPHESVCDDCHRHITISAAGVEYGHAKGGDRGESERCPQRPDGVDPNPRGGRDDE